MHQMKYTAEMNIMLSGNEGEIIFKINPKLGGNKYEQVARILKWRISRPPINICRY
jgi:hypothetical protein